MYIMNNYILWLTRQVLDRYLVPDVRVIIEGHIGRKYVPYILYPWIYEFR